MILIIYVLVFQGGVLMLPASMLVAILTIYSGAEYFWKLRGLFKKDLGL
jgi:phosphatidylglycerophosphate synthase